MIHVFDADIWESKKLKIQYSKNQGGKYLSLEPFQVAVVHVVYLQTCARCFQSMPCSALLHIHNSLRHIQYIVELIHLDK